MPKKKPEYSVVTYSTLEVAKGLGIPFSTVRDLYYKGHIVATTPAVGKAVRARFTKKDVHTAGLYQRLVAIGITRETAGRLSKGVREGLLEGETPAYVVLFEVGHELQCISFPENTKQNLKESAMIDLTHRKLKRYVEGLGFVGIPGADFDPEWRVLLTVNFKMLSKEIDAALEKL